MLFNTKQDIILAMAQNKDAALSFLRLLKGSTVKRVNIQTYPEDYDQSLQEGDEGYLPPVIEELEDLSTINSFELSVNEIDAMIASLE